MNNRSVFITKGDMEQVLKFDKGWIQQISGNEFLYDFHLKSMPVVIKVATSIRVDTDLSRNRGADAIRVFAVIVDQSGEVISGLVKSKRVNRTFNWRNNLISAVQNVIAVAKYRYARYRSN